jgi:hypothetical protein
MKNAPPYRERSTLNQTRYLKKYKGLLSKGGLLLAVLRITLTIAHIVAVCVGIIIIIIIIIIN